MVTGTKCEAKIYQGDRLVSDVGSSLQGGLADGGYNQTFQRALYGVPKAGENYAIVIELMMFETDEPAQHFWSPASGTKYKMLYEQSFRLTVSK